MYGKNFRLLSPYLPLSLLLLFSFTLNAQESAQVTFNLEAQALTQYRMWQKNTRINPGHLPEAPSSKEVQLTTLQLKPSLQWANSSIHANLIATHAYSYRGSHYGEVLRQAYSPKPAPNRDIFNMTHKESTAKALQSGSVTELYFMMEDETMNLKAGRFQTRYGHGSFFNPINPLIKKTPFKLNGVSGQRNDGFEFLFSSNPNHLVWLYIMADRSRQHNYNIYEYGGLARSIILKGDRSFNNDIVVTYLLGEDQQRHKAGFEIFVPMHQTRLKPSFNLQALYSSKRLDHKDDSQSISAGVTSLKLNWNNYFSSKLEVGASTSDRKYPHLTQESLFNYQRFYQALINAYQFKSELIAKLNFINTSSGLAYQVILNKNFKNGIELMSFAQGARLNERHRDLKPHTFYLHNEIGVQLAYKY